LQDESEEEEEDEGERGSGEESSEEESSEDETEAGAWSPAGRVSLSMLSLDYHASP
jgi:hypothetical protein